MTEFWQMSKEELGEIRQDLGKKMLEVTHIEELKYRQMWASDFYRTDCSRVDIFVQQYLVLHVFSMFEHFRDQLIESLPQESEFILNYWDFLQKCCADSLKIECTVAVQSGIPRMVSTLKNAWENRIIPPFQTFQEQYDPALFETKKEVPPAEPTKRGRPKQGNRQPKRQKK